MSESYIAAEIDYAIRAGVEVEVWRRKPASNPGPIRVPVHEGRFGRALAQARPDVVHFHWLKTAVRRADAVARAGYSLTVRGHWHFDRDHIDFVSGHPAVEAAYMYPHALRRLESSSARLRPLPASYNSAWYRCADKKDPTLVARTAAGKRVKDLALFVRVASRLPDYRFVLVVARMNPKNPCVPELLALNQELGNPVDIRVNVEPERVPEIVSPAGIYLHTYDRVNPFGMPVSIAEAMATGSFVLAPDREGAAEYIGDAGQIYRSEDEAVEQILATQAWSEQDWAAARARSVERAAHNFADHAVLPALLADWCEIKRRRDPAFDGL
jgi:glycosyltransferase involved in cell wall biosynthesis